MAHTPEVEVVGSVVSDFRCCSVASTDYGSVYVRTEAWIVLHLPVLNPNLWMRFDKRLGLETNMLGVWALALPTIVERRSCSAPLRHLRKKGHCNNWGRSSVLQ